MELTFLQAKVGRLSKTVLAAGIEPYPLAAQFRSETADANSIDDFASALRDHANRGHCLHVGNLIAPLADWGKRASLADRQSTPEWLVLDVDGLAIQRAITTPIDATQFAAIVDDVIAMLDLPVLANVSCVAQASTKLGLAGSTVSMHLFYLLDAPTNTSTIKSWLKHINLESAVLSSQIRLSANGHALSFPIDVSCADAGRLIYIAPPVFRGAQDPFADPDDRIVIVRRQNERLNTASLVAPASDDRAERRLKNRLREAAGYNPRETARYKTINVNGEAIQLLMNPAAGVLQPAFTQRGFCYYNLNGGNSNAYYHAEHRPDIIYNFKGEPPFRWADVDRAGWEKYRRDNAEAIARVDPINTFIVINQFDDTLYKVWHNHETETVTCIPTSRVQVSDFYIEYGKEEPPYIPTWTIDYNPPANYQVDYTGQSINTFVPSRIMSAGISTIAGERLHLANATPIAQQCPSIWFALDHVSGNDRECVARFINWLAFIVQNKRKTGTAWIFQGVEGTGKGTLYDEILSPILGTDNVTMKQTTTLNDGFDAWRKNKLLVCFDEFQVGNNAEGQALISRLRNWITEERASIRAMRKESVDTPLFENYVFFSNMHNMIPIPDSDRRYNVCPRQDRKLNDVCDTYALYPAIRAEIDVFGSLLHCWDVDVVAAQTCLDNTAKQVAREASRTMPEEFANAIKQGNLDYFLQLSETLNNCVGPDQILQMDHASRTMSEIVRSRHAGVMIATSDLANLYNVLHSQKLGPVAFSKMLTRLGLIAVRFQNGPAASRGILVKLDNTTLDDEELDALVPRLRTLQAIA